MPAFTVFGDLTLNRTRAFVAAAQAAGAAVEVIPYTRVLSRDTPWHRALPGGLIRLESPGRDFGVERALLQRGSSLQPDHSFSRISLPELSTLERDPGLIFATCQWYHGWQHLLAEIAAAGDEAGARFLNRPSEIALMFDKPACHAHLVAAGVPVPAALPPPSSFGELMEAMRRAGWRRVFLKPSYGSGANGVVAFAFSQNQMIATTAVELVTSGDNSKLYATRRLRTYRDPLMIQRLIDALCRERLHVESWVPKAGLEGRTFDARVVVIGGRACHLILRCAKGPITNLHLEAQKQSEAWLAKHTGQATVDLLRATAEKTAACFPDSLCMGIDIALTPTFKRAVVLEVNAFGDLLEGVTWQGTDTYTREVQVALDRDQRIKLQAPHAPA